MHEAFIPKPYSKKPDSGKVSWQAPSNIALVKYWGKKPVQIPCNPSISLTLDACATRTQVAFSPKQKKEEIFDIQFHFEGKEKPAFIPKIRTFFERIEPYLPFLKDYHFDIRSENTFPHSSGIASSASSMAALALCLVEIEQSMIGQSDETLDYQKASFLARLGSGSACRSIKGKIVVWGAHEQTPGSSDLHGIPWDSEAHTVFHDYHDTILLIDSGQKEVSSTLGHRLMEGHSYAAKRFSQAHDHLAQLQEAMRSGDLDRFTTLVELEALTLHAMMMTSSPSYILMKPNTLNVIRKLQEFRENSDLNPCFTLDAGANVHILYPEGEKDRIYRFIADELVQYCENGGHICDRVGDGAKKLPLSNTIL